ncbi:metallophosphoesterase [Cohnella abietis]|uniref:Phosphoesterase n=1 Tax=Cohnella abietis TaxID=2507935 RepID=A0A3T1D6M3_9BACL|nr:metallophosphoesterase [Cohnella abietis]BBI33725.1 phosphoesterase [Cohnella abietis]
MKMNSRTSIMITFFLAVYTGINYYLGWHITEWFDGIGFTYSPWAFWVPFGIIAFGYIAGRVPLPQVLKPIGRLLKVVGSYYIFIMEAGFLLFLIGDLIRFIVAIFGANVGDYALYANSAILAIIVILLVVGSRNAWSPVIRKYDLEINKVAAVDGKKQWTVAVASDIHLGNVVGRKHLKRLIDRVNAMDADLVLLPGDVIDDSIEPFLRNKMGNLLSQLKAKEGVYAILGNHEYYGGHVEQYIEEMNKIGIRVLRDETVDIAGQLHLAGRKDKTAESLDPSKRLSADELLRSLDKSKPIILMDHQPTKFAQAAEAGADIMLSGHTHRGQFFPNHLVTKRLFELDWGYMRKGAMHVIVSSGFGSWGPAIRIGSRSEIIQIKVKLNS